MLAVTNEHLVQANLKKAFLQKTKKKKTNSQIEDC